MQHEFIVDGAVPGIPWHFDEVFCKITADSSICGARVTGLGVLAIATTLERHKQLRNVTGRLALDEAPVSGYEVHAGVTSGEALERPAVHLEDRSEGALSATQLRCRVGSPILSLFFIFLLLA